MDLLQNHPVLWMSVAALLGLQFGSFLNVVVWRLPVMMHVNGKLKWRKPLVKRMSKPFSICPHLAHTAPVA